MQDISPPDRSRRALLKRFAYASFAAYLTRVAPARAQQASETVPSRSSVAPGQASVWRGVNLGSWLVLERWMAPSVFQGYDAQDEYTLSQQMGGQARARLQEFRNNWITESDFAWIAARGLNCVRLPVGYWVLDGPAPYVPAPDSLDRAFTQAAKYGLGVLLDLHGAPGSQNGWDHSGRAGDMQWPYKPEYIAQTLDVVEALAAHCQRYANLIGFELLNEPRWDVPIDTLKNYYQEGYARVRKHLPSTVAVVIHDGFRPFEWSGFMQEPDYANVLLDTHQYQCYTEQDAEKSIPEHIAYTVGDLQRQLDSMREKELPTLVAEWSAALDNRSLGNLAGFARTQGIRAYADAQIETFESTRGWFYWSYKLERDSDWSFRDRVKNGILPYSYDS